MAPAQVIFDELIFSWIVFFFCCHNTQFLKFLEFVLIMLNEGKSRASAGSTNSGIPQIPSPFDPMDDTIPEALFAYSKSCDGFIWIIFFSLTMDSFDSLWFVNFIIAQKLRYSKQVRFIIKLKQKKDRERGRERETDLDFLFFLPFPRQNDQFIFKWFQRRRRSTYYK